MPTIQTERLLLKSISADDLENLVQLLMDPEVMRFSVNKICSREKTMSIFQSMIDLEKQQGLPTFSVSNSQGDWMGICGCSLHEGKVVLAYRFFKRFWGQGFATEAVRALRVCEAIK